MAGVAFKRSLSCISRCPCRFIHAGLCIWGPQIHGRSCSTNTHNTGSFMILQQTAQCTAMTKQGSCALAHIPPACSMNADHPHSPPPPQQPPHNIARLPLQAPYLPTPPSYADSPCSSAAVRSPSDYIKKSSPLSGPSWPCYTDSGSVCWGSASWLQLLFGISWRANERFIAGWV